MSLKYSNYILVQRCELLTRPLVLQLSYHPYVQVILKIDVHCVNMNVYIAMEFMSST